MALSDIHLVLNVGRRLLESQIICGEQEAVPGSHLDALLVLCRVLLPGALLPLLHNKPKVLLCLQPAQGLQSLVVIASLFVFF